MNVDSSRLVLLCGIAAAFSLREECYSPPLPNSECGFYDQCLEEFYPCGPSGYALGYGLKYCDRFTSDDTRDCVSEAGREWINSTLKCLQESLVPVIESDVQDVSCQSIKLEAFDSHSKCYTGGGEAIPTGPSICFLPSTDVRCIFQTIDKEDLLSPLGVKEDLETARVCKAQREVNPEYNR